MKEEQLMTFANGISDQSNRLSELMNSFGQSVNVVESAMKQSGDELLQTSKQLSNYITVLGSLSDSINKYLSDIHQINFPARLEKLDATTAGIMAAVQSAQSRIDLSERNLSDALRNILELNKNHQSTLDARLESMQVSFESKLASQQKRQVIQSVITWLIIAAACSSILYFFRN
jgi:methyl-accepting chemotaxis protein